MGGCDFRYGHFQRALGGGGGEMTHTIAIPLEFRPVRRYPTLSVRTEEGMCGQCVHIIQKGPATARYPRGPTETGDSKRTVNNVTLLGPRCCDLKNCI